VTLDSVDLTIWYAGIVLDAVLLGLLMRRRVYKDLPVFFIYLLWSLYYDLVAWKLMRTLSPEACLQQYMVGITVNALFVVAVWIELGRKVLRYNGARTPGRFFVFLLFLVACLPLWLLAQQTPLSAGHTVFRLLFAHLRQIIGILMVAVLLTMAWLSRILDLRWPERELRIATGFGFTFIVSLAVNILQNHWFAYPIHRLLDQISVAGYLGTMAYWVLSFSQNETKQQKYYPQV